MYILRKNGQNLLFFEPPCTVYEKRPKFAVFEPPCTVYEKTAKICSFLSPRVHFTKNSQNLQFLSPLPCTFYEKTAKICSFWATMYIMLKWILIKSNLKWKSRSFQNFSMTYPFIRESSKIIKRSFWIRKITFQGIFRLNILIFHHLKPPKSLKIHQNHVKWAFLQKVTIW